MSTTKQKRILKINFFAQFLSALIALFSLWSYTTNESKKHRIPNSAEATASDWKSVGADLRYAQRQFARQNPLIANGKK